MLITFIFTSAQVCLIVLFCRKFYLCDSKYTQSVQVLFNRCSCWEMISQYISIVTANTESRNVLKILLYTRFCAWLIQHWFVNAENKCTLIQPSNLFTIRVFFFLSTCETCNVFFFFFSFFGTLKVSMWLHVSDHVFHQSSFKTIYPWRCFILLYMDGQPEWVLLACSGRGVFHQQRANIPKFTANAPAG